MTESKVVIALLLTVSVVSGCATRTNTTSTRPAAAVSGPAAPGTVPNHIRWMQVSAEYTAIAVQTYRLATARVEADSRGRAEGSWGVVLDADDTIINNLEYQSGLFRDGVVHTPERFTAFVRRFASTPVPGAARFLSRVRALGGRIAIVTNRLAAECDDTAEMLRRLSLVNDAVICRPEGASSGADKTPRYRAIAAGQTAASRTPIDVLVYVGDNIMDFPDGRQAMREQGEAGFPEVGIRWFVLPNPMYGSWQ
jgi:5'-nucleotidase (lipoprotein e(P4) family)